MKQGVCKCPVTATLNIIGGRWKPIIIWNLSSGGKRFGQLHAVIRVISRKVLTEQLKQMEADDLLIRTRYKEIPPRVFYELSDRGRSLEPVLKSMCEWGTVNVLNKDTNKLKKKKTG